MSHITLRLMSIPDRAKHGPNGPPHVTDPEMAVILSYFRVLDAKGRGRATLRELYAAWRVLPLRFMRHIVNPRLMTTREEK